MPKLNQKFISNQSMKNDFVAAIEGLATAMVRSQASIIIPTSLFTRERLEVGEILSISQTTALLSYAHKSRNCDNNFKIPDNLAICSL